ncbi:MAG: histidine kinase N-terminal 7TM domain-containing protein [Haloarculaceae archaeon]
MATGSWLTPELAVALMLSGVLPALANVYLLYDYRRQPGVVWFILAMVVGGLWALLYVLFTVVPSPGLTLAIANFFWPAIPSASVAVFLLAYEYVFRQTVSNRTVALLFFPIVVLFVLSWANPANLVFTADYHVGPDGFLRFPMFDGIVKILVTQVYGYLLAFLAAGMFVGEAMRARGVRQRQALYLLTIFSILILSTMVKVAGLVPIYFDPTSVVLSLSGALFAFSIHRHGLLKFVPVAREQGFQEVDEVIIVVDPNDVVVDVNRAGRELFDVRTGTPVSAVLPDYAADAPDGALHTARLDGENPRYFSLRTSSVNYGRGLTGTVIVMGEVSALKRREMELDLLKQVLSRIFRHNVRNELNVISGYAEVIGDRGDEEIARLAAVIRESADSLLSMAGKTRTIEDIFEYDRTVSRSLVAVVDEVLAPYRTDDRVVVRTDVADVVVGVHPRFELAVRELVENAVRHRAAPTVELDVRTEIDGEHVVLVVEDDGPGIAPSEVAALNAEEETDLQHGSGVGLWLVRLLVVRSDGTMAVETTARGTRVRLHLRRPTGSGCQTGGGT